jgi:hypothetical protein
MTRHIKKLSLPEERQPLRYHHKKKCIFTQIIKPPKPPYTGASVAHVRARLVHCTITWVRPCPMLWKKNLGGWGINSGSGRCRPELSPLRYESVGNDSQWRSWPTRSMGLADWINGVISVMNSICSAITKQSLGSAEPDAPTAAPPLMAHHIVSDKLTMDSTQILWGSCFQRSTQYLKWSK